jgi:hypothetical protein
MKISLLFLINFSIPLKYTFAEENWNGLHRLLQNNEKPAQERSVKEKEAHAHARFELSATERKALDLEIFDRFLASDVSMPVIILQTSSPVKAPISSPQPQPYVSPTFSPAPVSAATLAPIEPKKPTSRPVSPPNNLVVVPPVPLIVLPENNRGMRMKKRSNVAVTGMP